MSQLEVALPSSPRNSTVPLGKEESKTRRRVRKSTRTSTTAASSTDVTVNKLEDELPTPSTKRDRVVRVLELRRLEVQKILEIDTEKNSFCMTFFLTFAFPGGANDKDLADKTKGEDGNPVFPLGEDDKPTFLPSAAWFATKFDFNNILSQDSAQIDTVPAGDDIELRMYYTCTFHEIMQLDDFPFDGQYLPVRMCLNVRREGPMPVDFRISDEVVVTLDPNGFAPKHLWKLDRSTLVFIDPITDPAQNLNRGGAVGARTFPSINFAVHVRRRPNFVVHAAAVPSAILSILTLLQFTLPLGDAADRMNAMLTLVLTAFAGRATGLRPPVAAHTLLDHYTLSCEGLILIAAIFSGMLAWAASYPFKDFEDNEQTRHSLETSNTLLFGVQLGLWVLTHGFFLFKVRSAAVRNSAGFAAFPDELLHYEESSEWQAGKKRDKSRVDDSGRHRPKDWAFEKVERAPNEPNERVLRRQGSLQDTLTRPSTRSSSSSRSQGENPRTLKRSSTTAAKEARNAPHPGWRKVQLFRPAGWMDSNEKLCISKVDSYLLNEAHVSGRLSFLRGSLANLSLTGSGRNLLSTPGKSRSVVGDTAPPKFGTSQSAPTVQTDKVVVTRATTSTKPNVTILSAQADGDSDVRAARWPDSAQADGELALSPLYRTVSKTI